jgi:hypothetical protein
MDNFTDLLFHPLRESWEGFVDFVPNLLAMIVIMVVGIIAARVIRYLLARVFVVLSFDKICDRAGFTAIIRRADLKSSPSGFAASVIFWFLVIAVLMIGLNALQLKTIDTLTTTFFQYLPRVVSAVLILIIGYTIAGFLSRAVLISAVNSGFRYAKITAEAVRLLLIILILAMALEQLQIAPGIVIAAFSIVFGGIVLALSISFGVAGADTAKKIIEKSSEEKAAEKEEGRDMEHL